jgi:hypothetical protein
MASSTSEKARAEPSWFGSPTKLFWISFRVAVVLGHLPSGAERLRVKVFVDPAVRVNEWTKKKWMGLPIFHCGEGGDGGGCKASPKQIHKNATREISESISICNWNLFVPPRRPPRNRQNLHHLLAVRFSGSYRGLESPEKMR